ncbi:MAG: HAD hydrolase-like protein [Bacteroidetes bacterium]|nr:HAD hydrolase-like protein [Bacteroidota bacterium]
MLRHFKEKPQAAKLLIWDWNGTLLDDAAVCVEAMNVVLAMRNMKPLENDFYASVFTFPVSAYYQALGFDFSVEPFETPAMEFMDQYISRVNKAPLRTNTIDTLSHFKSLGYKQIILSAMEHELLVDLLNHHRIGSFFDHIAGISNHMGHGKTDQGIHLMRQGIIDPENSVLIGDTLHDLEVAAKLGCSCILLPSGHQSAERLREAINRHNNAFFAENLIELRQFLR